MTTLARSIDIVRWVVSMLRTPDWKSDASIFCATVGDDAILVRGKDIGLGSSTDNSPDVLPRQKAQDLLTASNEDTYTS